MNGGPAHSGEEDDGDALTVDDLPERLTVGSSTNAATSPPVVTANTVSGQSCVVYHVIAVSFSVLALGLISTYVAYHMVHR